LEGSVAQVAVLKTSAVFIGFATTDVEPGLALSSLTGIAFSTGITVVTGDFVEWGIEAPKLWVAGVAGARITVVAANQNAANAIAEEAAFAQSASVLVITWGAETEVFRAAFSVLRVADDLRAGSIFTGIADDHGLRVDYAFLVNALERAIAHIQVVEIHAICINIALAEIVSGDTNPFFASVTIRAFLPVVTGHAVEGLVRTSRFAVTRVFGTRILVVAGERFGSRAYSIHAHILASAQIAVVAR